MGRIHIWGPESRATIQDNPDVNHYLELGSSDDELAVKIWWDDRVATPDFVIAPNAFDSRTNTVIGANVRRMLPKDTLIAVMLHGRKRRERMDMCHWLLENDSAKALGVDTLLAWSISGGRACDDALRAHYPEHAPTVIPQNSLYSAMTINGILVAQTGLELGIPLVESHPKLLLRAALEKDPEGAELAVRHRAMLEAESGKAARAKADDRADALVAAWCASRWWFNRWPNDLYTAIPDDLTFPAGPAVYPWLEPIGST